MATGNTALSPNDPTFNQPNDYSLSYYDPDGHLRLTSRYYDKLSVDERSLVIAALKSGNEIDAKRIATCGQMATVDRVCSRGKYAHARTILCHLGICCKRCGAARAVLGKWARNRPDLTELAAPLQVGIELFLAEDQNDASTLPELRAKQTRDQMVELGRRLLVALGCSAVSMDRLSTPNSRGSLRIVTTRADVTFSIASQAWKRIAGRDAWCTIIPARQDSVGLLEWVAGGYEEVLKLPGEIRAAYRQTFKGCRMIRTHGNHYTTLKGEGLRRRREEIEDHKRNCGVCPDHHPLDIIPQDKQAQSPIEDIHDRYEVVDYHPDYDPFACLRIRCKRPLTYNLSWLGTPIDYVAPSPPS